MFASAVQSSGGGFPFRFRVPFHLPLPPSPHTCASVWTRFVVACLFCSRGRKTNEARGENSLRIYIFIRNGLHSATSKPLSVFQPIRSAIPRSLHSIANEETFLTFGAFAVALRRLVSHPRRVRHMCFESRRLRSGTAHDSHIMLFILLCPSSEANVKLWRVGGRG